MANRMKEDEKNERIIRNLLKLPDNRRCINCNSLGPQYVCTNFWTFICTACSGIHREFTHRVKSVSMAKFTSQEVGALQGGGNKHAREIFLKEWDPQRHSFPDSSNVERLRDFIRHVYVDRRYTGERGVDKPTSVKMGDKDDPYESRTVDTSRGGSGSPPYEDAYGHHYGERSGPGRRHADRNFRYSYDERSPGHDQENQRYGAYRRSPVRFEVVDDRFRDDRSGNGRRSEDSRSLDGESKLDGRSPNHQKISSPPMVRPVRDILGENVPTLRVGEPPKANGGRIVDGPVHAQRTASSSSMGSVEGNSVELKRENSATLGSLIDFNADPEPPNTAPLPQMQQTPAPRCPAVTQPTNSATDGDNWASFDFSSQDKVSQAPSGANALESILAELSAPAAVPGNNMSANSSNGGPAALPTEPVGNASTLPVAHGMPATSVGHMSILPTSGGAQSGAAATDFSTFSHSGVASAATLGGMMSNLPLSGIGYFDNVKDVGQWPNKQLHQPSLHPPNNNTAAQHFSLSTGGASNHQQWSTSLPTNAQGPLSTATLQSSQAISKPIQDASSGVLLQPAEANSSGRKEIPVDLFAANYSSVPATIPRWQTGPTHFMGYNTQYPTAVPMPTFPHLSKSTNPFDLKNEPALVPTPTFPSMASLQGALPNMSAPTGLLRTSSLVTPSPQQMLPQSPYNALGMPSQSLSPSYAPSIPPNAYMAQEVPHNMPNYGHQGAGGISSDGGAFGIYNMNQPLAGRPSAPSTPNSFSAFGGNPFG